MQSLASNYVDSAPSLISKERGKALINKWSKILDFTDNQTKQIEGYQKRLATALMCENQETWLRQNGHMPRQLVQETGMIAGGTFGSGNAAGTSVFGGGTEQGSAPSVDGQYGNTGPGTGGNSDWYAPGDARLPKTLIPMIRRTFPELITHEIVGVQPMSGPVGLAFALRYFYDQDSLACTPYNDKACLVGSKTFPQGPGVWSGSNTDEAGYQKLYTAHTGITAAGLSGLGLTTSTTGSGSCFDFAPADMGVAQLLAHFEASSNIPTMSLKIEKQAVEAGTRRLGTSWSMELEQDLMNMNGIDIDAEMTNAMSYEIQAEIDREMVIRMIQVALNAGFGTGYSVWKPQLADGRWFAERGVDFYAKIVVEANRVAIRNRRGPANFIIATPKVCTILQLLPEFRVFEIASAIQAHPNGVARVGTLAGQFNIYRDTRTEAQYLAGVRAQPVEYALLGYKGSEFWDTGIVYCPYIPVLVQRTISPHTFTPNVGMMTRYGVIDHLFGSQNFYHLIIARDLNTGDLVTCGSAYSAQTPAQPNPLNFTYLS
jgi:hypothetical protein